MIIKSFSEVHCSDVPKQLAQKIKSEIENKGKEYILEVDEEAYKAYLVDKYTIEPLLIDFNNPHIAPPIKRKEQTVDRFRGDKYEVEVYHFTISYSYTGSTMLFKVRPNTYMMTATDLDINEHLQTVSFSFKVYKQDPVEFNRTKDENFRRAFSNYDEGNPTAHSWNKSLSGLVSSYFQTTKDKYLNENNFYAAVSVKVNENTKSIFTAPTVTKKIIPQPSISKNKKFSSEPVMSEETYRDILKVIYDSGKSMEKKPSLYQNKDEEALRDQFLFVLETRYIGTTVGGETFNRGGKTDIILKYAGDGSNLFVAECKFWHGASEFKKAISQLFDRYLSWRDSKVALILFVKNKEFTLVNATIQKEVREHDYFIKEVGAQGETSFSYIFRLPQDKDKHVYFEIITFHYDK